MALAKKFVNSSPEAHDDADAGVRHGRLAADAQKRKARTFARQQKAAERIASATTELSSGIAEATSAAEELRAAAEQIAVGAEQAASAAQRSLKAVSHGAGLIFKAKDNADRAILRTDTLANVIVDVSGQISLSIDAIGRAVRAPGHFGQDGARNWTARPRRSARSSRRSRASPTRPTCWR